MNKNSTVLLVFGNILHGDKPRVPPSLVSEIKCYGDGVTAIKFPGQVLSSVGASNIIRDMLDSPNVIPRKTFYARYGSIWVVTQDAGTLNANRLRKWLECAPDIQGLFEESADGFAKFLPFEDKRNFVVWVTSKALEQVPEIAAFWHKTDSYSVQGAPAYRMLLTDGTPSKEIKNRIDWCKHPGIILTRFREGKYIIHTEGEPANHVIMNLIGIPPVEGVTLLQCNLFAQSKRDTVSLSEQEDNVQSATKTTNAYGATGYVSSIIGAACEQQLEQMRKTIKDKDAVIQNLLERLERSNKSIIELTSEVDKLAAENESLKTQLKLARSVASAIDKQKDLPKNEFEPKYIVVKGVKYRV